VEGAALCLNNRDEEPLLALARELRDAGTSVVTVVADVSDPQSPRGSRRRASPPTGRSTCWSTTRR
jgi:short-subunit dehydrogenase